MTPKAFVRKVRKSLIETKIIKLNEKINALTVLNSPQPEIDEINHRRWDLISEYKKLE